MHALRSEPALAGPPLERALSVAELLGLDDVLVEALTSKAVVLLSDNRFREARLLLEGAIALAEAKGLWTSWQRASNNLGVILESEERLDELIALSARVGEQALRRGDRERVANAYFGVTRALGEAGRFDDVAERVGAAEGYQASRWALAGAAEGARLPVRAG